MTRTEAMALLEAAYPTCTIAIELESWSNYYEFWQPPSRQRRIDFRVSILPKDGCDGYDGATLEEAVAKAIWAAEPKATTPDAMADELFAEPLMAH